MDRSVLRMVEKWIETPGREIPKFPDYPREEYEARWKRARELMAEKGIDALIITHSSNGFWFTGYSYPTDLCQWGDIALSRAAWFILPKEGEPVLYVQTMGFGSGILKKAQQTTYIKDVGFIFEKDLGWPRYELWNVKQIVKNFKDLGLEKATLGWELGDCLRLGISYNDFNKIKELMPNATFVDASMILLKLRWIRSDRELALMRGASERRIKAAEKWVSNLKVGMTEKEAWRIYKECLTEVGADSWDMWWDVRNPKYNDYAFGHHIPIDRAFRDQDYIHDGGNCHWRGGGCDIQREYFLSPSGKAPEIIKRYYKCSWEQMEAEREAIKPGVKCSEVFEAQSKVLKKYGLPPQTESRAGHGIGVDGPRSWGQNGISIHPECQIVLEVGMTLALEPRFSNKYGLFSLEDDVVVTKKGCENLHKPVPGPDLPIIG